MKKLLLLILNIITIVFALKATIITSTSAGDWSAEATWDSGSVPTDIDTVVIATSVTVTTTQSCELLTINAGATLTLDTGGDLTCTKLTVNYVDVTTYGTLDIEGGTLTTTDDTNIYGKFIMSSGTFNEGNSSGDSFYINGADASITINGGTINTSRYFGLISSSSFTMTGGTLNINSSGGTSSTDIFYVPYGTTFTMSSGTINILNGNLGTGAALKFNPTTANVTGGTINFTNVKGYSTTTIIGAESLYDLNCAVGNGDTLIITNQSDASDNFSCHNFTVTSGVVIVPATYGITINNTLTTNNNFTVESDANGNGSLIVNGTVTGDVTVQRYIAQYTSNTGTGNGWHLISSPIDNMAIAGSDFEPGTADPNLDDFYAWDEATNTWLNYKVAANNITNFTNGEGYLVAYQSTATKSFIGILINSDIPFTNLSFNSSQGDGWHLLGNPYPSALTWGDANWSLNNVVATAKVWNESAGNYSDVASGDIIPSTNGFFIQVTSGTNSLTIPSADRIHNVTNNYKSTLVQPAETLKFKVTSNANSYYDESTVGFRPDAKESFNLAYDSHKLFSMVNSAPSLYTVADKQQFSTKYFPETSLAFSIPIEFIPGVSSVYHLSISGLNSFDHNMKFTLEDTQTGTTIDLSQQTVYDFSATKGDDPARFILHINGVTAVPSLHNNNGMQIFSSGNTVYLHATGQKTLQGKVSVLNMLGQKIYEGTLNGGSRQQIRLSGRQPGIYFVRVEGKGSVVTQKVFLK